MRTPFRVEVHRVWRNVVVDRKLHLALESGAGGGAGTEG
jgi:hypothetical protein